MHKKAQGLSLNTVVIAAIVLIVLVLLVAIVMGAISNFSEDFDNVRETSCSNIKDECSSNEKKILGNFQPSLPPGKVCCRPTQCSDSNGICVEGSCPAGRSTLTSANVECRFIDPSKPKCCIPGSISGAF